MYQTVPFSVLRKPPAKSLVKKPFKSGLRAGGGLTKSKEIEVIPP